MPNVTITYTNVSTQTIANIMAGLEKSYERLPGETDIAMVKRVVRILLLELANRGLLRISAESSVVVAPAELPD